MTRTAFRLNITRLVTLGVALLIAAVLISCQDDAPTAPAGPNSAVPGGDLVPVSGQGDPVEVAGGTVNGNPARLTPERRAELDAALEERRREADAESRKLLASFKARVYDPTRDDALEYLQGRIDVRVSNSDGTVREGAFVVAFNAENETRQQTIVVPDEGADALPANSQTMVQRLVSTGIRGTYFYVVTYLPNVQLALVKTKTKQLAVHCPPTGNVGSTYVFNEQDLVVTRGMNRGSSRSIDHFTWENPAGRHLLVAAQVEGAPTSTTWSWDDSHKGIYLPELIRVRRGSASVELRFTYSDVRVRAQPLNATPK